jgi:calcineurin-like phosphoesterase family protein
MRWVTSDEHFSHFKIIEYCNRPFSDVQEMDRTIVDNHNSLVKSEDVVYHVGDFMMCRREDGDVVERILSKLNGTHILIFGNHDKLNPLRYVDVGFRSAHTSLVIDIADKKVILCHDPAAATVVRKMQWLCGHVHGLFKQVGNVINVGVDVWDFKPVSEEEIIKLMEGEKKS